MDPASPFAAHARADARRERARRIDFQRKKLDAFDARIGGDNFRTFVRKYFRTKISCKNNFNNTVHDYTYVYVYTCTCTVRVLS